MKMEAILRGLIVAIAGVSVVGIAVIPLAVLAQQQGTILSCPNTGAGIVPCTGLDCTPGCLFGILIRIFNWLLSLAAYIFIAVVIWAGVRMILYHLQEQPEQELIAAKMTLSRGVIGFSFIVAAIVIVNTLLILLGVVELNPDDVGSLLHQLGFLF